MDCFCLSFTSGSNIQKQLKLIKQQAKKKKNMTAQNFKIAPFRPFKSFRPPPIAPFQIFAPKLTKIAPLGAIRPTLGNPGLNDNETRWRNYTVINNYILQFLAYCDSIGNLGFAEYGQYPYY